MGNRDIQINKYFPLLIHQISSQAIDLMSMLQLHCKPGVYLSDIPQFQNYACYKKYFKGKETQHPPFGLKICMVSFFLGHINFTCVSKHTFPQVTLLKNCWLSEQITKRPQTNGFLHQVEVIVCGLAAFGQQ